MMTNFRHQPPLLAFIGRSGVGKTTLLQKVIPLLTAKGLSLMVIKHSHHNIDIDMPHKDSYRLRQAGAQKTVILGQRRWALISEEVEAISLSELLPQLPLAHTDLILLEGFKHDNVANIVLSRQGFIDRLPSLVSTKTLAIASDNGIKIDRLPILSINDPNEIGLFIQNWIKHLTHQNSA